MARPGPFWLGPGLKLSWAGATGKKRAVEATEEGQTAEAPQSTSSLAGMYGSIMVVYIYVYLYIYVIYIYIYLSVICSIYIYIVNVFFGTLR